MKNKRNFFRAALIFLSVSLFIFLPFSAFAAEMSFKDVPSDAWYYKDVKLAFEGGLITGKSAERFGPDDNLTYAETVTLAARIYMYVKTGSTEFTESNPWYQTYVDYAKNNKIITRDYIWNDPASRAEFMDIFSRAIPDSPALAGIEPLYRINDVEDGKIPDVPMTHPLAYSIYAMYRAGIVQGSDAKHNCYPETNIRRSEVATILTRMIYADERISFTLGTSSSFKIITQPSDFQITADGQEASYTISVSGGKAPYRYRWYQGVDYPDTVFADNTSTSSTNKASFTAKSSMFDNANEGVFVRCIVTDDTGKTLRSEKAQLLFSGVATSSPLKISTQPENAEATVGETITLKVEATGGKKPYSYKWEWADSKNTTFKEITWTESAKTACLTETVLQTKIDAGTMYRCVVTDTAGSSVTSNAALLTAKDQTFKIKVQPTDAPGKTGEWSSFSVEVTGGKTPYSYDWQMQDDGPQKEWLSVKNITDLFKNADTKTLSTKCTEADRIYNTRYRCVITDADGKQLISNTVKLIGAAQLTIISQPESTYGEAGSWVKFTVEVTGGEPPYSYDWQMQDDGPQKEWLSVKNITDLFKNADTKTLSTKTTAADWLYNTRYRCVIIDSAGTKVTSVSVNIKNSVADLLITKQPEESGIRLNQTVTFKTEVTGGKTPYSYKWQYWDTGWYDADGRSDVITNENILKHRVNGTTSPLTFRCVITDSAGNSVTTNEVSYYLICNELSSNDFLFYIEDILTIKERGIVLTGRVVNGNVRVGDSLSVNMYEYKYGYVQPIFTTLEVKEIEMFRKKIDYAEKGDNIGISVGFPFGKDSDGSASRGSLQRGDSVVKSGSALLCKKGDYIGTFKMYSKSEGGRSSAISDGFRPQFYYGATDVSGTFVDLGGTMQPGETRNGVKVSDLFRPCIWYVGQEIEVREGGRVIGTFTITEVRS